MDSIFRTSSVWQALVCHISRIPTCLAACFLVAGLFCSSLSYAQEIDDEFEDLALEEIEAELEFIDALDALDGINESDIFDEFEIELDENGLEAALNEWILIADPAEFAAIRSIGITIDRVERLGGLELALARIQTQGNLSLTQVRAAISVVAPLAEVDLNHIYRPNAERGLNRGKSSPADLLQMPVGVTGKGHKVGIIDTAADISHPVFSQAKIETADFVRQDMERPLDHGTAVLSILAGTDSNFQGLLPDAEYFLASVFFTSKSGGRTATADSLVKAISWLKENDVPVINMSLAGPPNRVLKRALDIAIKKNTVVIAAVGNDGPNAKPLYPAAYSGVIGVTAVSRQKKIYRLAGRGEHVDFSAPGVRIRHAGKKGGFDSSSGTSMAAPFVTAAVVASMKSDDVFPDVIITAMKSNAEDLGTVGFDAVFGYGLVHPENY